MANKHPANLGDVFKHLILCRALEDQPSRYLESHGGAFTYSLADMETGAGGIWDFLEVAGPESTLGATRYAKIELTSLNQDTRSGQYLGSIGLAHEILEPGVEILAAETLPSSAAQLEASLNGSDRPCTIHRGDGNRFVVKESGPRDLVLLDPYDVHAQASDNPDAESSLTAFSDLAQRGVAVLLWYALTPAQPSAPWALGLQRECWPKPLWQVEIQVLTGASGLGGCGFVAANLLPSLEADCTRLALTLANELRGLGIDARIGVDSSDERRVVPSVDGHEEPELLVQHALGIIKAPLARFVHGVVEVDQEVARRQLNKRIARKKRTGDNPGDDQKVARRVEAIAPEDARELIRDLQECRSDFEPRLDLSWVEGSNDLDRIARCLETAKGGRTPFNVRCNEAMHGVRIQIDDAIWALEAFAALAKAIRAPIEAIQLETVIVALSERSKRSSRKAAPRAMPAPAGTTTIGVHWVQPRRIIPGAWWMVALEGGTRIELSADLSTHEVIAGLSTYLDRPALAGLAYCFSIPQRHLRRDYADDVGRLWESASRAAGQTDQAEIVIDALRAPFRVLGADDAPRDPDDDPDLFRETEMDVRERLDTKPASIFDLGGAGSVGALAVKGMRVLAGLRAGNAAIWPLQPHDPNSLTCVEIFPRALWATLFPHESPSSKKNPMRRWNFIASLQDRGVRLDDRASRVFGEEERAFDALLTAWALHQYGGNLAKLQRRDAAASEGQIWLPE